MKKTGVGELLEEKRDSIEYLLSAKSGKNDPNDSNL